MAKGYTAQEMRETSKCLYQNFIVGTRGLYCPVNSNDVIAMLRQSADAMEREGNKCGDCAKFGNDCNAGDVDGNEDCRACDKFISKETAAKDAENEKLRKLVKELTDMLNASCDCHRPCHGCDMANKSKFDCFEKKQRALIARARKTIGGAK